MSAPTSASVSQVLTRKRKQRIAIYDVAKNAKLTEVCYESECDNPQNTNLNEILWNSGYIASGLKSNLHGAMYQLKHLMLILHRAREQKLAFELATEMDSAESFDDLVFFVRNTQRTGDVTNNTEGTSGINTENETRNDEHRLVQLKHRQDDSKKITSRQLLGNDEDFSIKQYFRSWHRICKHPVFYGCSESEDFILCTNIELEKNLLPANPTSTTLYPEGIRAEERENPDNFLKIVYGDKKRFRLVVEGDAKIKLYEELKLESDQQILAKELADRVCKPEKKPVNLSLKVPIFKTYRIALIDNVIDTEKHRFRHSFIDCEFENSNPTDKQFSDLFMEKITSLTGETKKAVKKRLKEIVVEVSDKLGDGSKPEHHLPKLPHKVDDTEIDKFFKKFTLVVGQPNEVNLGGLINNEVTKYNDFGLLNNNFIGDSFLKNILNWFKAKQGFYFDHKIAKYFFEKAECELSSLITVGLNLAYLAEFDETGAKFTDTGIKRLKEFLGSSNDTSGKILQFVSFEDTVSTAERIYETVKEMEDFKKNDSFIFMHLKKLLSPKIKDHVVRALTSPRSHKLLVVDCGLDSTLGGSDELFRLLSGIINGAISRKTLILITDYNDSNADGFRQFCCKTYITCTNGDIFDGDIDQMDQASLDIENGNEAKT